MRITLPLPDVDIDQLARVHRDVWHWIEAENYRQDGLVASFLPFVGPLDLERNMRGHADEYQRHARVGLADEHPAGQPRRLGQGMGQWFLDIQPNLEAVMVGPDSRAALDDPDVDAPGAATPDNRSKGREDSDSQQDGQPDRH